MINLQELLNANIRFLRENSNKEFISIYDYPIYNNILFEDLKIFKKNVSNGSTVLDFGCGRGTTSFLLSKLGYNVTGLDLDTDTSGKSDASSYVLDKKHQEKLWNKLENKVDSNLLNFDFYKGLDLPYKDNYFDSVFAYAVLEHVSDIRLTLKELHRVLNTGGVLYISRTPNKYSYSEYLAEKLGLWSHENKYSKSEIIGLLKSSGFDIVRIDLVDFFPSNLPKINDKYQRFARLLFYVEKFIRMTPLNFFSHHWRILALKK